jgi:leucyl-tRNA synthetase
MHKELLLRFIEVQAILISPICPHFAEKTWKLLGKSGSIVKEARWPTASGATDRAALVQDKYLEDALYVFRNKITLFKKKTPNSQITEAEVTVSLEYAAWIRKTIEYLQTVFDAVSCLDALKCCVIVTDVIL